MNAESPRAPRDRRGPRLTRYARRRSFRNAARDEARTIGLARSVIATTSPSSRTARSARSHAARWPQVSTRPGAARSIEVAPDALELRPRDLLRGGGRQPHRPHDAQQVASRLDGERVIAASQHGGNDWPQGPSAI